MYFSSKLKVGRNGWTILKVAVLAFFGRYLGILNSVQVTTKDA
jgi:hypothetical protein